MEDLIIFIINMIKNQKLVRRIASDKLLRDKAFDTAINPQYY